MEHVIGFAIHERVTAMPATRRKKGCLDVGGVKHLSDEGRTNLMRASKHERRDERTTRTLAPNACGGKFEVNFPFTTPELPCGRVTRLYAQAVAQYPI